MMSLSVCKSKFKNFGCSGKCEKGLTVPRLPLFYFGLLKCTSVGTLISVQNFKGRENQGWLTGHVYDSSCCTSPPDVIKCHTMTFTS